MMFTRKELAPINEAEPSAWEEFVVTETRRKVAKCLEDLGRGCSPSSQRTVKHFFWHTCDALKALDEAADGFPVEVRSAVSAGLTKCIHDLGVSVSPSDVRTIRHWFGILESDILEG